MALQFAHEQQRPRLFINRIAVDSPRIINGRGVVENLALVMDTLHPSMTEVANLFDVSRQTVYNWQKGGRVAPDNERRLKNLAGACQIFLSEGIAATASVLRRKFEGRSVAQAIMNSSDAATLTYRLVRTLKREAEQRQRLAARLQGRNKTGRMSEPFGAPSLDE
jgi:transcriptional regulator with XRE-family HTH domain